MADYIYATELDAYNVGNKSISEGVSYVSTKLCTRQKAWLLGCTVNHKYPDMSDASANPDPNTSGITYLNNQLILKDDLGLDPGNINSSSKTIGFAIGSIIPVTSSGANYAHTLKSTGATPSLLGTLIRVLKVAVSPTPVSGSSIISWSSITDTSKVFDAFTGGWTLFHDGSDYYIILQKGRVGDFSTNLLFVEGNSASCSVSITNSTITYNSQPLYLNICISSINNTGDYVYYLNIPISKLSSSSYSSKIFSYASMSGTDVGLAYRWKAASLNM